MGMPRELVPQRLTREPVWHRSYWIGGPQVTTMPLFLFFFSLMFTPLCVYVCVCVCVCA
jgi:hypothetical protein